MLGLNKFNKTLDEYYPLPLKNRQEDQEELKEDKGIHVKLNYQILVERLTRKIASLIFISIILFIIFGTLLFAIKSGKYRTIMILSFVVIGGYLIKLYSQTIEIKRKLVEKEENLDMFSNLVKDSNKETDT